ncbi:MAG: hypothetical protein HQL69_20350 [Magnetococcales bacterium]|nr:hypothetical protein [Magnetococcales bacterium]
MSTDGPYKQMSNKNAQPTGRHPTTKNLLSLLLLLLIILMIPAMIARDSAKVDFDDSHIKALRQYKPDYIFIGNSILYTRIDNKIFNREIGKKAAGYQLALGGSGPTQWYLWFKNSVIGSGVHPKAVFLYFLGNEITYIEPNLNQPDKRLLLARASMGEEKILDQIIARNSNFKERVHAALLRLYPIQLRQPEFNWLIDSLALLPALPIYRELQIDKLLSPQKITEEAMQASLLARQQLKKQIKTQLFATSQWRIRYPDQWTITDDKTAPQQTFAQQLPNSLLPEMLKLAKKHNIKLVFVKAKLKPRANGSLNRSPTDAQYTTALNNYLTKHGFVLHDFALDKKIEHHHYIDESHIDSKHQAFYTRHFIATLSQYFQPTQ